MNAYDRESVELVSPTSDHCFFGYYDKSPWSGDERHLLYHRVGFIDRNPQPSDEAEVILHDLKTDEPTVVGRTTAWNFQMGSSLQWLGPEYDRFAFNDREGESFVARIYSAEGDPLHTVDYPLYTTDPTGGFAITVNFARLQRTRPGYGYQASHEPESFEDVPTNDGLYRVSLPHGGPELIVSLAKLASVEPAPSMDDGIHWINHLSFSPSGDRIAFLHRWELEDGGMYTRLFTVRPDGTALRLVLDSGKVTHYSWRNDKQIVAWARQESSIGEASRRGFFQYPLISQFVELFRRVEIPSWIRQNIVGDQYYLLDLNTGTGEPIGAGVLNRDGHPSFARDGQWMVSDTYPDSDDQRHLLLYNLEEGRRVDIGSFQSRPTLDCSPFRCDLHPRWNRSGTSVCFDSVHNGHRGVYVVNVALSMDG